MIDEQSRVKLCSKHFENRKTFIAQLQDFLKYFIIMYILLYHWEGGI